MSVDLISAYSARVAWSPALNITAVVCTGLNFYDHLKIEKSTSITTIVNLKPESSYTVKLVCGTDVKFETRVDTCPEDSPCLDNLYAGLRNRDGIITTTQLNKEVHDVLVKNFSSIVESGDTIVATVSINGVPKEITTSAVTNGSTISIDNDNNIFLPFSTENTDMQTATLKSESGEATLAYDPEDDSFGYGGEMYRVGDKFEMLGKSVTVGYGSIVLVFADTVAKTWVFPASNAASVSAGSAGSNFTSNLTASVMNLVATKADLESTSTYNSTWAHNTDDNTTVEMTRMVHTIDEASANATLSLGVRHLDASSNYYIEPIIQGSYDATTISSQDAADATASATFTYEGLRFDTEDAAVYFGASQEFRIRFVSGTPSFLQMQSYDSGSTSYITRMEISDAA